MLRSLGLIELIETITKAIDLKILLLSVSANGLADSAINQCFP